MINTFIAFDENDDDFGEYFFESHNDIISDFQKNKLINYVSICGLNCTEKGIIDILNSINENPFVFIAISHGNEDEFCSHEVYISATNANQFRNSFIYSTSCSTGKNLAKILIDNGSLAFIGYNNEIFVPLDYSKLFYTCENYGIKSFFNNDETIETSYNKLIEHYTAQIDILLSGSMEDLIIASTLLDNRDKLTFLGNGSLTRKFFN